MEKRTEIQEELQSLSPLLASMDKVNVFTVPQGYFESISPTVLACINESENNLPSPVQNTPEVPQGYFDSFAGSVLDKIKVLESHSEELKSLSTILASVSKENVFAIPDGYFDSFAGSVLSKIETLQNPAEELKHLSTVVASASKENIFDVPQGYFEQLPQSILQKVKPAQAKVVYMQRKKFVMRYAAAAVITGVMALGVYKFANTPVNQNGDINNSVIASLDPSIEKGRSMNEADFNNTLDNLSEEAITKYLEKNGDETDIAALSSGIEENSLPAQEDYLLDENALENYLKEIENIKLDN
jgi:hypothetical protein